MFQFNLFWTEPVSCQRQRACCIFVRYRGQAVRHPSTSCIQPNTHSHTRIYVWTYYALTELHFRPGYCNENRFKLPNANCIFGLWTRLQEQKKDEALPRGCVAVIGSFKRYLRIMLPALFGRLSQNAKTYSSHFYTDTLKWSLILKNFYNSFWYTIIFGKICYYSSLLMMYVYKWFFMFMKYFILSCCA